VNLALLAKHPTSAPRGSDTVRDEDRLIARARQGDRTALAALVENHQRGLYYLALRYTGDASDAQDAVQKTFVRAFERLQSFRGTSSFRTWLFRIAINLCLNDLRRAGREEPLGEGGIAHPPVGIARMVEQQEKLALLAAIAELPAKQRTTVELRIFDELPFREIAALTETSESAARVNFHHAIQALRRAMKKGSTP
jgi:RNA polymerase sigma-70 factor (ECF subfamily)